jgi:hypothetical protein
MLRSLFALHGTLPYMRQYTLTENALSAVRAKRLLAAVTVIRRMESSVKELPLQEMNFPTGKVPPSDMTSVGFCKLYTRGVLHPLHGDQIQFPQILSNAQHVQLGVLVWK